jgi:hypothetical protein
MGFTAWPAKNLAIGMCTYKNCVVFDVYIFDRTQQVLLQVIGTISEINK